MTKAEEISGLVRSSFPNADSAIIDYISGVVSEMDEDDLKESGGLSSMLMPLLEDYGASEDKVEKLCVKLVKVVLPPGKPASSSNAVAAATASSSSSAMNSGNVNENGQQEQYLDNWLASSSSGLDSSLYRGKSKANASTDDVEVYLPPSALRLLTAPLKMSKMSAEAESNAYDPILNKPVQQILTVDRERLARAEARLKKKQSKRALKERLALIHTAEGIQAEIAMTNQANAPKAFTGSRDIKIENFDVFFAGRALLQRADLSLNFGRRYGLVGRNGIGKTTLLRSIAARQLAIPKEISIVYVEQEVVGDETLAVESVLEADVLRSSLLKKEAELLASMEARKKKGQGDDAQQADELNKVYYLLEEIEADRAPAKVASILAGLSFSPEMQLMKTKEFSGGWRMRLALARALFIEPDLLLLDEPTNMLDINAILWLEDYLQTWPGTILCVSHDRDFLNTVCTDIVYMHHQRLDHYKGDFDTFEKSRDEKLANQQKEYDAQLMYRQHLQDFIDRWRYNAKRAPQAQSKIKILEKLPPLEPVEIEQEVMFRFPDPEPLSGSLVEFSDVYFGYSPDKFIFKNINFGLRMNSRVSIVGANGMGKTTLLKMVTGDLDPTRGYVNRHRVLKVGYFSQHHVDQLDLNTSAVEFLRSKFPGKEVEDYRRVLGSYGLSGDVALQPIRTLSGGQKSRVAFGVLGLLNPHLLVLDEPTNHLDVETVSALINAINSFPGGVILVSHDERMIKSTCQELWVVEDGKVIQFDGSFHDYKTMLTAAIKHVL